MALVHLSSDRHRFPPTLWNLTFQGAEALREATPEDARTLILYDAQGQPLDCIHNLIGALWETGGISDQPGIYRDIPLTSGPAYVKFKGNYVALKITANATVRQEFFFGQWPVRSTEGFSDQLSGALVTRQLETADLNFEEVTRSWQRLENRSDLSVDPVIEMVCKNAHQRIPIEDIERLDKL